MKITSIRIIGMVVLFFFLSLFFYEKIQCYALPGISCEIIVGATCSGGNAEKPLTYACLQQSAEKCEPSPTLLTGYFTCGATVDESVGSGCIRSSSSGFCAGSSGKQINSDESGEYEKDTVTDGCGTEKSGYKCQTPPNAVPQPVASPHPTPKCSIPGCTGSVSVFPCNTTQTPVTKSCGDRPDVKQKSC